MPLSISTHQLTGYILFLSFFIQNVLGDICEEFKETFTNIFILQNQQCK